MTWSHQRQGVVAGPVHQLGMNDDLEAHQQSFGTRNEKLLFVLICNRNHALDVSQLQLRTTQQFA